MKRNRSLSACPTAQESVAGGVYFIFQLVLLPSILRWVNAQLSQPLTETELNFTYYLINFLATILIYHEFLGRSARQATQHLAYFCQAVVLGLAAYYACNFLTLRLIRLLVPGFTNYNDASITVSATLDGIERIRTWKYSDRSNDQKTPFNLSDCHFESGEDPRKNYTTMDYCFMIREEDLMQ